jgi:hypothetical protein
MKKRITQLSASLILILFLIPGKIFSQDIQVIVHETFLSDTIGSEMVFDFEVVNISNQVQTVFEVRTINDLPPNWQSSLCFGENCFSPGTDSVASVPPFANPLDPGDTLITSLHVFALMNEGTAHVQIQVGTFHDPGNRTTLDFTAVATPTAVEYEGTQPDEYYLTQNYPNPFNPSTIIKYGINEPGFVSIKIYDVLGSEVATLVNQYHIAGSYEINFNSTRLSSGTYIYRLVIGNYSEARKMILEK